MSALVDGLSGWLGRRADEGVETNRDDTDTQTTSRTGGSGNQEPVVVWAAANLMEAQIVKGRLVSQGIPAIVRGESLGPIYGLTAGKLASTDVLVPALLAEKAQQILGTDVEWPLDEEDVFVEGADDPSAEM